MFIEFCIFTWRVETHIFCRIFNGRESRKSCRSPYIFCRKYDRQISQGNNESMPIIKLKKQMIVIYMQFCRDCDGGKNPGNTLSKMCLTKVQEIMILFQYLKTTNCYL